MSEDSDDDSQKTEEPTQRKLEEARKRGQVPVSREVASWMMLFAGTVVVLGLGPSLMSELTRFLTLLIAESWHLQSGEGIARVVGDGLWLSLKVMALPLVIFVIAAVFGPLAQIGPMLAPEVLLPDWSKVSIVKGIGRLFSMRSVVEFLKGLFKITLVGVVAYYVLEPYAGKLESFIGLPVPAMLVTLKQILRQVMTAILSVFFIIVAADIFYQRLAFMRQMRMSRQDLRDEFKQTEGDPHVKGRLRQLRMEKARSRMMSNVPTATVVITNPTHYAVALRYRQGQDEAPVCVAKGADFIAKKIREVAEESKVVIVENPPLARTLYSTVEIDETIKEDQYKAVAEVISFVYRLKGGLKK